MATLARRTASRPRSPKRCTSARVGPSRRARAKWTRPGRLAFRSAGTGHAGDRHGDVGVRAQQRFLGHGPGHRVGHGAMGLDQPGRHAEHLRLGRVGVGDETAVHHIRRAGDFRQQRADETARTAFRRRDHDAGRARTVEEGFRLVDEGMVEDHVSLAVTTAWAARPSPRPVKPSFSVVVALMLTRCGSSRSSAASRVRIASR